MPKGLVVHLDDEVHKKLKAMSINEGKALKDLAYDIIKNAVDAGSAVGRSEKPEEHIIKLLMGDDQ